MRSEILTEKTSYRVVLCAGLLVGPVFYNVLFLLDRFG